MAVVQPEMAMELHVHPMLLELRSAFAKANDNYLEENLPNYFVWVAYMCRQRDELRKVALIFGEFMYAPAFVFDFGHVFN